MQVAIQSTNVVKVLKLLIIVTLAFAFTAMAQESGNSRVANGRRYGPGKSISLCTAG